MSLEPGQKAALENLARKAAGQDVGWINIADARALTTAGLAERDRQGWRITPAGSAVLHPPRASRARKPDAGGPPGPGDHGPEPAAPQAHAGFPREIDTDV